MSLLLSEFRIFFYVIQRRTKC